MTFCPTHHRMIWHPECKEGPHSRNSPNKLQILNIYPTAPSGYAVEFKNFQDKVFYECYEGTYQTGEGHDNGQYNNNYIYTGIGNRS